MHLKRDIDDSFIKKTVFEGKRERTKAKVSAVTTKNSINNTGLTCSDRNPKSCVLTQTDGDFCFYEEGFVKRRVWIQLLHKTLTS